jgi:hypothetical protein
VACAQATQTEELFGCGVSGITPTMVTPGVPTMEPHPARMSIKKIIPNKTKIVSLRRISFIPVQKKRVSFPKDQLPCIDAPGKHVVSPWLKFVLQFILQQTHLASIHHPGSVYLRQLGEINIQPAEFAIVKGYLNAGLVLIACDA